jgi:hypothetical protein
VFVEFSGPLGVDALLTATQSLRAAGSCKVRTGRNCYIQTTRRLGEGQRQLAFVPVKEMVTAPVRISATSGVPPKKHRPSPCGHNGNSAQFSAQESTCSDVVWRLRTATLRASHIRFLRTLNRQRPPEDGVHRGACVVPLVPSACRRGFGKSCEVRLQHQGGQLMRQCLRVGFGITNERIVQHHAILFRFIHYRDTPCRQHLARHQRHVGQRQAESRETLVVNPIELIW